MRQVMLGAAFLLAIGLLAATPALACVCEDQGCSAHTWRTACGAHPTTVNGSGTCRCDDACKCRGNIICSDKNTVTLESVDCKTLGGCKLVPASIFGLEGSGDGAVEQQPGEVCPLPVPEGEPVASLDDPIEELWSKSCLEIEDEEPVYVAKTEVTAD